MTTTTDDLSEVRRWTPRYDQIARSYGIYRRMVSAAYKTAPGNLPPRIEDAQRFVLSSRQMTYITDQAMDDPDPIPAKWMDNLRWPYPVIYIETPSPIPGMSVPMCPNPHRPHEIVGWLFGAAYELSRYASATPFYPVDHADCCGAYFSQMTGAMPLLPIPLYDDLRPGCPSVEPGVDVERQRRYSEWLRRTTAQVLALLMSKSVRIATPKLPRSVRRAESRQKNPPKPWRLVQLDLKADSTDETGPHMTDTPDQPGLRARHDVIGHIRRNRHRLADGNYRHTLEWVRPHQRGSGVLIPKTYRPVAGSRIAPDAPTYLDGRRELN